LIIEGGVNIPMINPNEFEKNPFLDLDNNSRSQNATIDKSLNLLDIQDLDDSNSSSTSQSNGKASTL
jgi:hypothetical protein